MLRRLSDNQDPRSLATRFRKRRSAFFRSLVSGLTPPVRILDVGGTESYWRMAGLDSDGQVSVTLLNLSEQTITLPNLSSIVGDARRIDARAGEYDVVFSNSVIEHLPTHADQIQMANEVRRAGKRYFVQTPNRYFPLEPHFLFPFYQFLPVAWRIWLLQNFNLGWFRRTPERARAAEIVNSIRLLSRREFVACFPEATLYEEKVFRLTKSFVAYAGWDQAGG